MAKGKDADPAALIEAFDDLPEATRQALRRALGEHADNRVRDLARDVWPDTAIDEDELRTAIVGNASVEVREHAASALVAGGGDGLQWILDSPRIRALLTPETVVWAAARSGRPDAAALARRLSEAEYTPRLLLALGSAGYPDVIDILLHFVSDESADRADAAGASLAALTGVDLVEPGGEEDAASEVWSRSADGWRAALRRAFSGPGLHQRMVRGVEWSADRVEAVRADPHVRNGIRRALAGVVGSQRGGPSAAAYYWLQRDVSN